MGNNFVSHSTYLESIDFYLRNYFCCKRSYRSYSLWTKKVEDTRV